MTGIFPIRGVVKNEAFILRATPSLSRGSREDNYERPPNLISLRHGIALGPFKWAGMMPQLAMSATPATPLFGQDETDGVLALSYALIREAQGNISEMATSELLNLAGRLYTSVNILRSMEHFADAYTAYLLWVRVREQANSKIEASKNGSDVDLVSLYGSQIEDLNSQVKVFEGQVQVLFQLATEELLKDIRVQLGGGKDDDASNTFERLSQFVTDTRGLAEHPPEDEITKVSEDVRVYLQLIAHEKAVLTALLDPAKRRSAEVALEKLSAKYKEDGMYRRAAIFSRAAAEEYLKDRRFIDAITNAREVINLIERANIGPHSESGRAHMIITQALMGLGDYEGAADNAKAAGENFSDRTFVMEARRLYITALLEINTPRTLAMARKEFAEMGTEAGQDPAIKSLWERLEERDSAKKAASQPAKDTGGWVSWSSLWGSHKPEDPKKLEDKARDSKPARAAALYERAAKLRLERGELETANFIYRASARFYEDVRNDEALVRVLEQVLELDYQINSTDGPARVTRERLARSLLRIAQYAIESGNPDEASNAIDSAIVHLRALLPYHSVGSLLQYAYRIRFELYLKKSLFVSIEITMKEALNLNIITRRMAESWIESVEAAAKTLEGKDAAEAGRARRSITEMQDMVESEFAPIRPIPAPESEPVGSRSGAAAKAVAGTQVEVNYGALGWKQLTEEAAKGSEEARTVFVRRLAAELGKTEPGITEGRVAEILPRLGEIYAFESAIGLFELAAPPDGKADPDAILAGRIFGILEGEESVGAQARADLARGLAEAFRRGDAGIDAERKDGKPRSGEIDPAHIK